jgi:hypothetical protein
MLSVGWSGCVSLCELVRVFCVNEVSEWMHVKVACIVADRGLDWTSLTVKRKNVTKCRPLSLWPYCGILLGVRPR